jgi:secreted trypsin-like serine protease
MPSNHTRCLGTTIVLLSSLALSVGCAPGELDAQEVEASMQSIFNGTLVSSPRETGVVRVVGSLRSCSATVYSRYWILTAAHCFHAQFDRDGDGIITTPEGAGDFEVQNMANNSSGGVGSIRAWAVYKHPSSTWENSAIIDAALIFLQPGSLGAATEFLSTMSYTNGALNISQAATTSFANQTLYTYGYGFTEPNGTFGTLRSGQKRLIETPQRSQPIGRGSSAISSM